MRRWSWLLGAFAVLTAADRLTKLVIFQTVTEDRVLMPGFLAITRHENYGALANLPVPVWLLSALGLMAIPLILLMLQRELRQGRDRTALTMVFILAGAVGNVWDRISRGFVFDWLLLFERSAINLADIWIACGLVWLLFGHQAVDNTPKNP